MIWSGWAQGLKDFQRDSVEHAFRRLFIDADSSRRFLIADETGLGKTMVARGVITKTIDHLQSDDSIRRIDIVYVCSNTDIAEQNLNKLMLGRDQRTAPATRLSMLVAQPDLLLSTSSGPKPVTMVAFTPGTSFNMGDQSGMASERAVLYRLLAPELGVRGATSTALKRILQGGVLKLDVFQRHIDAQRDEWEPNICRHFLADFRRAKAARELADFVEDVRGHASLTSEQRQSARALTAELRRLLARAGVQALEPDLVILDEFQRFRNLLDKDDPSAELAHHLFEQPDSRVLLLSATPYKPFTLAEETTLGEDHYGDFFRTLEFLDRDAGNVDVVRADLATFREEALTGRPSPEVRSRLRTSLLRLMSRVERPASASDRTHAGCGTVEPADMAGFVALHRLASAIDAPLTVEYWKSAPYFANFLDGYRVGQKAKEALADDDRRHDLQPLLRATQRLHRRQVERFQRIDWGNARLRQLASDTIDKNWWQLLWIAPSLPYYEQHGVFADVNADSITKRIVFSSWVAAPTAIASLLSYEAERRIRSAAGDFERDRFAPRLQYRIRDDRPSAMTTLALFWPTPALASLTDPLEFARGRPETLGSIEDFNSWAVDRLSERFGSNGEGAGSATTPWYWASAMAADRDSPLGQQLVTSGVQGLSDALLGQAEDGEQLDPETPRLLGAHIEEALGALGETRFDDADVARPSDLLETLALLGVASPGNVAWRSLRRLIPPDADFQELALSLWRAAAVVASGFRTLFNRPDATRLLDSLDVAANDDNYWRAVLGYCRDGNLQAVVDEFMHHLAGSEGIDTRTADGLMKLAIAGRRALAVRGATYRATDVDHPSAGPIRFFGRFALRYGGLKQLQDDARLPEVRAAFNSPFWPFVLATTSIGQEGVDFHWWCHSIVHWNLPANPVDFEQREGRVNRFHGHAIRKNVAARHRADALRTGHADVWSALYAAAEAARPPGTGDMVPHWEYSGSAAIERFIMGFPLSRDREAWTRLQEVIVLYRMAYGQPRQDVMVDILQRRGFTADDVAQLSLQLRPPPSSADCNDSAKLG